MDLNAWQKHRIDGVRARRLLAGYVTGALLMGSVLGTVAVTAAKVYHLNEDAVVEAVLVDVPKEAEVVIKQERQEPHVQKPKPQMAVLRAPTKLDTKLVEKAPVVRSDNPYATEDPYALMEQSSSASEERPKVQEAPKVLAKPKLAAKLDNRTPIRITEDVTPPRVVSMQAPTYPAEARAAGIEGTVIVQYVVTEQGEVKDVAAVRGPPELISVCVAAVQSWRFEPALKDGRPVAVHRVASFPFRIKT